MFLRYKLINLLKGSYLYFKSSGHVLNHLNCCYGMTQNISVLKCTKKLHVTKMILYSCERNSLPKYVEFEFFCLVLHNHITLSHKQCIAFSNSLSIFRGYSCNRIIVKRLCTYVRSEIRGLVFLNRVSVLKIN